MTLQVSLAVSGCLGDALVDDVGIVLAGKTHGRTQVCELACLLRLFVYLGMGVLKHSVEGFVYNLVQFYYGTKPAAYTRRYHR